MTLPPTSSDRSDSDTSPASGLKDPAKKEIAMRLVSAAENSSLGWQAQYHYIEYNVETQNRQKNRGYTGRHHRLHFQNPRHAQSRRALRRNIARQPAQTIHRRPQKKVDDVSGRASAEFNEA